MVNPWRLHGGGRRGKIGAELLDADASPHNIGLCRVFGDRSRLRPLSGRGEGDGPMGVGAAESMRDGEKLNLCVGARRCGRGGDARRPPELSGLRP